MEGMKLRTTAETKMNEKSSRSHLLVTFHLYNDMKKMAKLTLVDLAGSENLKRSEVQNERKKEAQNINLSLFELTNVLRDLTIPNKVVSYRNSKLTMMLKVRLEQWIYQIGLFRWSIKESCVSSCESYSTRLFVRSIETNDEQIKSKFASIS